MGADLMTIALLFPVLLPVLGCMIAIGCAAEEKQAYDEAELPYSKIHSNRFYIGTLPYFRRGEVFARSISTQ